MSYTRTVMMIACLLGILGATNSARAQYFSNTDGFGADGVPRVQVELTPYLWLPATSANIGFADPRINGGSVNTSTSVPSAQQLASSLHGAFMGFGMIRYGNWSGEMDLQWVDASQSKTLFTGPRGEDFRVHGSIDMVRVAPGFGYKVYSGTVFSVPAMVDVRVGFAYFSTSQSLKGENALMGERSSSDSFVQPWAGLRATLVPSPKWRVTVDGLVQGFGVGGGSWGGGGSVLASYAWTDLISTSLGFRVLNTSREGSRDAFNGTRRSLNLTAYGPILGVGFRF